MVNLHVHTCVGSLLDSILTSKQAAEFASKSGQKAIALTDHGYMSEFVNFWKECTRVGVKPILGCEVYECDNWSEKADTRDNVQPRYHLILLAKSSAGLKNLFKIVSHACTDGFYKKPRTSISYINENKWGEGIICLTACQAGRLSRILTSGRETAHQEALDWLSELNNTFDDVFIEFQSHSTQSQLEANRCILEFVKAHPEYRKNCTITADSHMLSKQDQEAQGIFVEIGEGREVGESYVDCYLQTERDVNQTVGNQFEESFLNELIKNTDAIADMVETFDIGVNTGNKMPVVSVPAQYSSHEEYLRYLVYKDFDKKFGWMSLDEQQKRRDRLEKELPVIMAVGYCDYFIMSWELAHEADKRGIARGYGRGSAAGCLCLYMLGVTQMDSVRWELDFSRFANLGRTSMADVDWDIDKRRRREMVDISMDLYGADHVAPICTFNTLSTKVAIRDIGKVLNEREGSPYFGQIPYSLRNDVAKLIPTIKTINDLGEEEEKDILLKDLVGKTSKLESVYEQFPLWFKYVMALEGLPKSMGRHAAGTLITPNPIVEYGPLCMDREGCQMFQLEMHNAMDDLGLIKEDFLGLKSLTTIDDCLRMSGLTWEDVDINHLNLNDPKVFDTVYKTGHTNNVFQMESLDAKRMCMEAQCDSVHDIIVVNAANRPGTKMSFPEYCLNKLHPESVSPIHPDLKKLFWQSHSVLLYQEQALAVFRYAGFPESEVDNARRAIGKKKADVMKKLEAQLKEGLSAKGWSKDQIQQMWSLIIKQADYSFNLSHAASYGLLSYLTAYLKTHYPVQYMTACLIADSGDAGKMGVYINECNRMGIRVLPPSVNRSDVNFKAIPERSSILFGLGAIKGMGESTALQIIENRPYDGLLGFIEKSHLGESTIVSLVKAGAIPAKSKRDMLNRVAREFFIQQYKDPIYKELATLPKISELKEIWGINTDEIKDKPTRLLLYNKKRKEKWDSESLQRAIQKETKYNQYKAMFDDKYMQDEHMWEFEMLSMFLTNNPIKAASKHLSKQLSEVEDKEYFTLICVIVEIQKKKDKNGNPYAYLHVYTPSGIVELSCWSKQFRMYSQYIEKGNDVAVRGVRKEDTFEVKEMKPYKQWLQDRRILV